MYLYLFFAPSLDAALRIFIVSFWIVLFCADLKCTLLQAVSVWMFLICSWELQIFAFDNHSKNLVDHDCDGHIGAIARAFIDSNYILFRTGHIMLNGGNKYTNWFSQLIDIASTYKASESVNQQFLIECRRKRSISGMPKHAIKWLKMFLDSIHYDASWNFIDAVSANIFCLPGIWAADTFIYFQFIYCWHIYFNYN